MFRVLAALAALILSFAAAAAPLTSRSALATSGAHFFSATGAVTPSGALAVTLDEAGVGQETVNYLLSATSTATFYCLNNGGHNPSAANKETVTQTISSVASFNPTNGRVQGSIVTAAPSANGFVCPPGQSLVLGSVTYGDIVLTDITNGVSIAVAPASATFLQL